MLPRLPRRGSWWKPFLNQSQKRSPLRRTPTLHQIPPRWIQSTKTPRRKLQFLRNQIRYRALHWL